MIETIFFWLFAVVAVGGALAVVLHPSVIYSSLALLLTFMMVAGVFALNNADFIAISQVLVYAVGLTIVMLFAIMFTGQAQKFPAFAQPGRLVPTVIAFGGAAALVAFALGGYQLATLPVEHPTIQEFLKQVQQHGTTGMIGELLFSRYLLPFEVASILLTGTMVGAIVISRRDTMADAAHIVAEGGSVDPLMHVLEAPAANTVSSSSASAGKSA
jgi:NADH:ubiquinone oxidoreductase subunit 6 (subunit J)